MWHSHLNDMEIPDTKRFIPKEFELGTTLSLPNRSITYGYLPENRSFHTFNLCLIVPHFYIYTTAKETEPCSFLAFKAFPIEPSSVLQAANKLDLFSYFCYLVIFNSTCIYFIFFFAINNCNILYSSCMLSVPFILVL